MTPRVRQVVLHGHFYQPPRKDPWLELVPREPSAAPDHDWNVRITRECYEPLTAGRVRDAQGRLRRVLNAFAWCSFDVGPTLFRWFDDHAPAVRDAIVAGDHAAHGRLGFGNALAQPYHHIILPLATRRDKITEIRWGIHDFRARFGRDPEGIWLPETAVDHETLEIVAAEGIAFTVLAPHQVAAPPPFGRPGRWRSGGKELAIFCYDGDLAHDVAFGDALRDATRWHQRLSGMPMADDGATITSVATDGETFGHHHRFGDIALATLLDHLDRDPRAALTNFAAVLHATTPIDDVSLVERTAWSCPHELGRWTRDCGCRMEVGTTQAWRTPLRHALDGLATEIHAAVEHHWPAGAGDLWAARDAAGPDQLGIPELPASARPLLEAERHALAMFTSCAWFFDDVARVEPRIVLRHAARALDCLPVAVREAMLPALRTALAAAKANEPKDGTAESVWDAIAADEALGVRHLAAGLAALRDVIPDSMKELTLPIHTWVLDGDEIIIRHRRTGEASRWRADCAIAGIAPLRVHVRRTDLDEASGFVVELASLPEQVRAMLLMAARPLVLDAAIDEAQPLGILNNPALLRDALVMGAWALIARDGLEEAGVVLHAVLDLFALEDVPIPAQVQTAAFVRLAGYSPSPIRESLAARLHLHLPDSA